MSGGDDSGDQMLAAMIARLEAVPEILPEVLPKLGAVVKRYLTAANQAGMTPDGKPYVRTEAGHVPLRQGARAIRVSVGASAIRVVIRGAEARHSSGTARGRIPRPMLPIAGPPPALQDELDAVLNKHVLAAFEVDE